MLLVAAGASPAWAGSSGGAQAPPGQGQAPPQSQSPESQPSQPAGGQPSATGGSAYGSANPLIPEVTVPGTRAKIVHGYAEAPALAPPAVQQAIWSANAIVGRPYVYGGGHRAFVASGYDCSGTVSYALHGGSLLASPLASGDFESWGEPGPGLWITVFANGGHAYMNIAGIRLDTSTAGDPSGKKGPRWRRVRRSNAGFTERHPLAM